MLPATTQAILNHLKKEYPQAAVQKETGQILITIQVEGIDLPLFFRLIEGSPTIQLMTFLPFTLKYANRGDVARLLHLLNKEIDIPGFGMDELNHLIFFRLLIPFLDSKVSKSLLDAYTKATQKTIQLFIKGIGAVVAGETTLDDVLKNAETQPAPVG